MIEFLVLLHFFWGFGGRSSDHQPILDGEMPKIDAFWDGEMEEEIDVLGEKDHHNYGMFHCQIGSDRKPWPGQRFSNVGGNHIPSGKLT